MTLLEKIFPFVFKNNHQPALNRTVLVVDDSDVERRTNQRILEKAGYRVICAEDGETGLKIAAEEDLDLILLDCILPGIHGPEVLKKLKSTQKTKDVPVILLTGSDTPANIVSCYDLGAEIFLAKPVNAKTLLSQVSMSLTEK
ncbi:MAG: hypothetical protein A2Z88_11195 [Omnitrophica WOR_2 bacterium GWA2_47_8]|nr:MAG: hypothetical protein A2Z88_11195 [Omnitrophica WOR_2 bacterium GWA2_47_8]